MDQKHSLPSDGVSTDENALQKSTVDISHADVIKVIKCIRSNIPLLREKPTLLSTARKHGYKSLHERKQSPSVKSPQRIDIFGRLIMDDDVFNFIARHFTDSDFQNENILLYQSTGISVFRIIDINQEVSQDFCVSPPIIIIAKPYTVEEISYIRNYYSNVDIPLSCGLCNNMFSEIKREINQIMDRNIEQKTMWFWYKNKCNVCQESYTTISKDHILEHVIKKEIFCPSCTVETGKLMGENKADARKSKLDFLFHRTTTVNKTLRTSSTIHCQLCNTSFAEADSYVYKLLLQLEIANRRKYVFKCCACLKIIGDHQKEAEKHIIHHLTSRHVFCSECYSMRYDHLPHLTTDSAIPSASKGENFSNDSAENANSAYLSIRCDKCGKLYRNSVFILTNWIHLVEINESYNKSNQIIYNYRCQKCSKFSSDRKFMQEHILDHVRNGEIFCKRCSK